MSIHDEDGVVDEKMRDLKQSRGHVRGKFDE